MESIKYFIKAAFRAAIVVPLTAGNSVNPNNPEKTDGSLASMVTIACLTAITFVIIGIYGGKQTKVTEAHLVIWSLVMAMIILALICVIVISVVAYRRRAEWFVRQTESIRKGSLKLKIMFLWLFGFGIILETTLDLAINIDCLRQAETLNKYTYRVASIGSHLLSIIYYCLQMGFISYFIGYRFEGYIRINYGILIILLANLIHWFNSVVSEANDTYFRHNHTEITDGDCPSRESNTRKLHLGFALYRVVENDTYDDQCYWNSRIECFLEQLLPYLLPARIEYFLLATGFILGMWPSVKHDENNTAEENENDLNTRLTETAGEMTPLLLSRGDAPSLNSSYRSVSGNSHPVSFFISIMFGIVLNLPLLVCDLVLNFILEGNSHVLTAWQSIVLLYKVVMLIMAIAIFVHLSKIAVPDGHSKKLAANEYILIFSAAGSVALLTFGIIAGIQTRNVKGDLALVDSLVDIITIYVQTVLVIHSERKKRRNDASISTCCATEHLIILLSICNFVFWVTDSFIDFKYKKDLHIEESYFGKTTWNKVREILFPILIFYRFHVSIDLYGFFCKFRN